MAALDIEESVVLIIDMQTRLLPAIDDSARILERAALLAQAADILQVPVLATEHCVDKIGPMAPSLAPWVGQVSRKTHFDATREPGFLAQLPQGRPRVLLIGIEAHVCVLQTAFGLKQAGLRPMLVADCLGSRKPRDREAALVRAAHHGLEVATTEMALFEWLVSPDHPAFRRILKLLK